MRLKLMDVYAGLISARAISGIPVSLLLRARSIIGRYRRCLPCLFSSPTDAAYLALLALAGWLSLSKDMRCNAVMLGLSRI